MHGLRLSLFGERFSRRTGARELMDDLGQAMAGGTPALLLGGGNPALIPAVQELWRREFRRILEDDREFRRMVADYAEPGGEIRFREALAALLCRTYGWPVGPEHVALTAGSQSGFFQLFNLFAGPVAGGGARRVLLPMTPEYIGYADTGATGEIFTARRPAIELLERPFFKYRVDFAGLAPGGDVGALCASRPTNPTGNVLSDDEVAHLAALARGAGVPFILDCAYGMPFPGIVQVPATPLWDDNVVLCLSLSKLGLPGVRTGIVVARPEIVDALAGMNATMSLAVGSVGPVLIRRLVETGEILQVGRELIGPYYRARCEEALGWLDEGLRGCDYRVHRPEGAFFLWLWVPGIRVPSHELYRRLRARGVYVISGHHFFPGLAEDWPHRHECLRISYTQAPEVVREGLRIVGEEVRRALA